MGGTATVPDQTTSPDNPPGDPQVDFTPTPPAATTTDTETDASTPPQSPPPSAPPAPQAPATEQDYAQQQGPTYLTPLKPGGIKGVLADVMDAMAGRTRPELAKDDQGNVYVKERTLSRGEQWARIADEALHGAAAGLAAGKGAGNMAKAPLAGVGAGDAQLQQEQQQRQDLTGQADKQNLQNANALMLRTQLAKAAWEASRNKVKATQDDVKFADEQEDRIVKDQHGILLGTAAHEGDITGILHANPDVMKDLIQRHQIELQPHYNSDGTYGGIRVYKMPDGYRNQVLPRGTEFQTFDSQTGKYIYHNSADPITAGEVEDFRTAANKAAADYANNQAKLDYTKAQTAEANASVPLKGAQTVEARAQANKANADAQKARAEAGQLGGDAASMGDDAIVNGMLNNTIDIRKMTSLRNDRRERLVRLAEAKQPGWNEKKYEAAMDNIQDFYAGKDAATIQSANRFLGHAATLSKVIDELRNTNSPILNKPINKLKSDVLGQTGLADVLPFINAAANEHENFLLNGRAQQESDKEMRDKSLNTSMSPAQLQGALKSMMRVQLTQLGAMNSRFRNATGRDFDSFLDPNSKAIIESHGLAKYAKDELGGAWDQTGAAPRPQQQQAAPAAATPPPAHPPTPPPPGQTYVWTSDGHGYFIPAANVAAARQRDPGLVEVR